MAKEFRQRTPSEFLQILKRSKWHILLPTLALGIATAFVVTKLPNMYQSTTSLTLRPAQISTKVVDPLTEEDLSQRLQSMNQEILSRSSLEPLISKYKLFERERATGVPTELIIDKMRSSLTVEPERGEEHKVTGFRITYKDPSPEAARNVAADLATKYINAQIDGTLENVKRTRDFLEDQVSVAKTSLDAVEKQRLDIMTQNVDTLPTGAQGLIAQLTNLGQRTQSLAKEKETLIVEKGRLNDSIRLLNGQISIAQNMGAKDTEEEVKTSKIEDTPAYAQMIKDLAEWTAKKENLLKTLRDKHPDVLEAQTRIDKIKEQIDELKSNSAKRAKEAETRSKNRTSVATSQIELEKQRAESQILQIDQQIKMKDSEIQLNTSQIASLEAKINTIPGVSLSLEAIDNQYKTAKANFDELNKKRSEAELQLQRDQNVQGETIRLVDPANLPSTPLNASKKPMLIMVGAGLGLALGLFLAGIFEIPRLFKIQNIEDAKYYTGLPVLASVPPLLTRQEISWKKRSYWLKLMAGIIAAFGSIPLIIILLQKTRILERFVS